MKKILVIRLGALGDLVHASASWDLLKKCMDAEIHLLTSPGYTPLAMMMPSVSKIWGWHKQQGWSGVFGLAKQLRAEKYDSVINLHPSFKTALMTQLVLPKKQAVYHKQKLGVRGVAQRKLTRRHAVADFYEPFRRLFKLPNQQELVPRLRLAEGLEPQKKSGERWIGLIPGVGAKRSNRAWLPESYRTLIQELLKEPQFRILLMGGADERELVDSLMTGIDSERLENHCAQHDIPGTARLLKHCDVVIGGDTGPLHLAAGAGSPILSIFGPTSLDRTGPIAHHMGGAIIPPETLACWPCELATCPLSGNEHLACMHQIPVSAVLNACLKLLDVNR